MDFIFRTQENLRKRFLYMTKDRLDIVNFDRKSKAIRYLVIYFFLLIINLFANNVIGQSFRTDFNKFDFSLNIGLKQLYQNTPFEIEKVVDPVVDDFRVHDSLPYYSPFLHNSVYFKTGFDITFDNKYQVQSSFYIEQRDWSRGKWIKNSTFVFIKARIILADTFILFHEPINWRFDMGDLYSLDEIEYGLRAYNIDIQGVNAIFAMNNFRWSLLYAADMSEAESLNIDEYIRTKFVWEYKNKNNKEKLLSGITMDFSRVSLDRTMGNYANRYSVGLINSSIIRKNFSFDIIVDYMINSAKIKFGTIPNMAALIQGTYCIETKKTKLSIKPKFRLYGVNYRHENYENSYFNSDYRYRRLYYPYSDGNFMYPLKNYFRPLSQYAFYTEYQNNENIFSLELEFAWDFNIYRKLNSKINIEAINMHRKSAANLNYYNYIFYSHYLYINVFEGLNVGIYISNKQFNQDVHYMTFYQMKYPFFGLHITYNGKFKVI